MNTEQSQNQPAPQSSAPLDTRQALEAARLAYKEKSAFSSKNFFKVLAIIAVFFIAILLITTPSRHVIYILPYMFFQIPFFGIFAFIVVMVIKSATSSKEAIAYKRAYKAHFVAKALKSIFKDISYSHSMGMPRTTISSTGMMYMGDRYSSNDYVKANYKDHIFQQADVTIQREDRDSDGDRTYVTVFKGRYIVFELNKRFDKKLLVNGKRFTNALASKRNGFKKMELESSEFNKRFKVFAQDGFEAYYLLDPAFMERLDVLCDQYAGRVMICFSDNQMHIAIYDGKDLFEPPSPMKEIDDKAETEKITNEIKLITDVIDNLKYK